MGTAKAIDLPSQPASRYDALDALRGYALLGIFLINIIGFGLGAAAFQNPYYAGGTDPINIGLFHFTTIFVEGSMRGLFSLMFGAGVVLFTSRAVYPDGPVRIADLHYRRTIWLIAFGVIHGWVLLAPGDILFLYGVAGLFLFPFRILSTKKLVIMAALILAVLTGQIWHEERAEGQLGAQAVAISERMEAGQSISAEELDTLERWEEVYRGAWPTEEDRAANIEARTGDLATIYKMNAKWVSWGSVWNLFEKLLSAGYMMLIGMAFLKSGWLTGERPAVNYAILAIAGYVIGIGLRTWLLIERTESGFSPIVTTPWIFYEIGRSAVTIGHVGLFLLIWKVLRSGWLMRALAATGRMAFTNYVGQTVIANLIFIGFGLYAQLDRIGVYALLSVIFLGQMLFSLWWLVRYRYGPLEWLWRSLTYGSRQSFKNF